MKTTYKTYRFGAARLYVSHLATGLTDLQLKLGKPDGSIQLSYLLTQLERDKFMTIILGKMKRQLRYALNEGRDITQTELQL